MSKIRQLFQANIWSTILLIIILAIVGGFLWRDSFNESIGLPGAYFWISAFLLSFVFRLMTMARYMLPPSVWHEDADRHERDGSPAWREGLYLLLHSFFLLPLPVHMRKRLGRNTATIPDELPDTFKDFDAGFLEPHQALALARGLSFTRVAGPGYVRLNKGEKITHVVNLRGQWDGKTVQVKTRDGIPLETKVSVVFKVKSPDEPLDDPAGTPPFPYDPQNIFRLTFADSKGGDEQIEWHKRILPEAEALLVEEISKYKLDQLYQPAGTQIGDTPVPAVQIRNNMKQNLSERLQRLFAFDRPEDSPITILNAGFGQLTPPGSVVEQRIQSWQADWKSRDLVQQAEGQAETIRTINTQRAALQLEVIESITRNIEDARFATGENLTDIIFLRMMEALDSVSAGEQEDETAQAHQSVSQINKWLRSLPAG